MGWDVTYKGPRDGRKPHALAVLDDGVAAAEEVDVDVAALVDADLARGDDHDRVLKPREVRRAAHPARDNQAAADILDRQAREGRAGCRRRHVHHAAVEVRQAARGSGVGRAGGQTDVQPCVALQRDGPRLSEARPAHRGLGALAELLVVVLRGRLLLLQDGAR